MSHAQAKLAGAILTTVNSNGAELYWGICGHCAMVEELSARRCQQWQRTGTCEVCTEDVAEAERQQEAGYWRALSSPRPMMQAWRKAVFPGPEEEP